MNAKHRANSRSGKEKKLFEFIRKLDAAHAAKVAKLKREHDQAQAEIDRINALPLGDPENRHKIATTFDPISRFIDSIEQTGDIDVINDGTAVFKTSDNSDELWPVFESFMAVIDTYELIARDRKAPAQTDGLRKLAQKINVGMMLFQSDLDAARLSIAWMRAIIEPISPIEFSEYTTTILTRLALAEQRAA